jgi:hypothetical protein
MDAKTSFILENIADNYEEFELQASVKIKKQFNICHPDSYHELVSDVVYSVIDKLSSFTDCNRFYRMAKENKLRLYILKGISTNTSYYSSPFLRKKILDKNNHRPNLMYVTDPEIHARINGVKLVECSDEEERATELQESYNKQETELLLALNIRKMFLVENAPRIFGAEWKYYKRIFLEYVDGKDVTYRSIAAKYDLTPSSIASHIKHVKTCIRKELIEGKRLSYEAFLKQHAFLNIKIN